MIVEALHWPSVVAGVLAVLVLGLLLAVLLLGTRNSVPRRIADALLNRRGFEKLGVSHRARPRDTAYEAWLDKARNRIPVLDCDVVEDVYRVGLQPWEQEGPGVCGLYLRLGDNQVIDARILEIPINGSTNRGKHLFEMIVHVLEGSGRTELGDGPDSSEFRWKCGQVFSVPLNTTCRHVSDDSGTARLLVFTTFPLTLNLGRSEEFVYENPFHFDDRSARLAKPDPATAGKVMDLGVGAVLDAREEPLSDHGVRGAGARARYFRFAGNSMISFNLSEMPAERIKRAHRGNSDAAVLMLSGEGTVVMWPEGAWHRRREIEFRDGTLIAVPIYWYRQFISTGDTPARNLTASARLLVEGLGLRLQDQLENDLPGVRRIFRSALKNKRSES